MEVQEQERYIEERQKKLIKAEQQELQKQIVVRNALEKKLINQRNEQKRQRQVETKQYVCVNCIFPLTKLLFQAQEEV